MNELKESEYNHFKAGVIASREQLCVNEDLKKSSNAVKTHVCNALMKEKKIHKQCSHYLNVDRALLEPEIRDNAILDIEDLGKIGEKFKCCPYYVSKEKIKRAEIVFMPYNYLLDPNIRYRNQIELNGSIIILDEAHNVEKMCEDCAGTEITTTKISIAKRDLHFVSIFFINE